MKSNDLRQVWRVERCGEVFYAKVFKNVSGWERIRQRLRGRPGSREWRAGDYAERRGVPAIRFAGLLEPVRPGGAVRAVLVSYAVANASTLADVWRGIQGLADPADRAQQARMTIDTVARLVGNAHAQGFLHRDTHSDNLLIVRDERKCVAGAVFADLGQARVVRSVTEGQTAANLAELAQWFRTRSTTGQRARFLAAYLGHRYGWTPEEARSAATRAFRRRFARRVDRLARRRQRRLVAKRDGRIFRNNKHFHTATFEGRWRGTFTLRFRGRELPPRPTQADRTPDEWTEWTRRVFSDAPHAEGIAEAAGRLGLASRVDRAHTLWERFLWAVGGSPARKLFRYGHQQRNRDLPVAAPIAFYERRERGLVVEAILITEQEESRDGA